MNIEKAVIEILSSLEYDTAKEESFIADLFKKHDIKREKSLEKLTKKICSRIKTDSIIFEEFFGDILNYIQPFALMLEQIYKFLNDYSVTIESRASQFKFVFEKLQEKITFDISNFPKELIHDFGHKEIQYFLKIYEINLYAEGEYNGERDEKTALDFITCYDCDFYNRFLTPVSYFWALKKRFGSHFPVEFGVLEEELKGIFKEIKFLLDSLFQEFQLEPKQIDMRFSGKFEGNIAEVNEKSKIIQLKKGFQFDEEDETQVSPNRFGRIEYSLNCLGLALQFWENQYKRDDIDRYNWAFNPGTIQACLKNPKNYINLVRNQMKKYEKALHDILVFKGYNEKRILLENVVEFVRLPYWKHRWHIYELWTLVLCLSIANKTYKVILNLKDHDEYSELIIPKADAKKPVASILNNGIEIECWFQRKTVNPITGKGIEPDLRFMARETFPADIFIVENKDRRNCSGTHIKKVLKKYFSGTSAKNLWIVNYEGYQTKKYSGKLFKKTVENRNVFIASNFKPAKVPVEFHQNFSSILKDYFESQFEKSFLRYDLIIDKSGSMDGKPILATVKAIFRVFGSNPNAVYLFDNTLTQLDFTNLDRIKEFLSYELDCTKGTELVKCFHEYLESKNEFPKMIYILTDGDGLDDCFEKFHIEMLNKGSSLVFVKI